VKKKKDNPTANLTMPDGNDSSCTSSHVSAPVTTDGNEPAAVTELVSVVNTVLVLKMSGRHVSR